MSLSGRKLLLKPNSRKLLMPEIPPFILSRRDALLRELAAFRPLAVYLFGSFALQTSRPDSDVDIAFLPEFPVEPFAVFTTANTLADLFGREVDLVDLNHANTVMAKEVLRAGILLDDPSPVDRQTFEMRTLSDYARLNEERRPVLASL
ncbi:MAG: nucleotidyltransferase domain-containing protein [Luteolibacter sp.]